MFGNLFNARPYLESTLNGVFNTVVGPALVGTATYLGKETIEQARHIENPASLKQNIKNSVARLTSTVFFVAGKSGINLIMNLPLVWNQLDLRDKGSLLAIVLFGVGCAIIPAIDFGQEEEIVISGLLMGFSALAFKLADVSIQYEALQNQKRLDYDVINDNPTATSITRPLHVPTQP